MKAYKDLKEIKEACRKVDSCSSGSDGFMYKCFPYLIEQMMETRRINSESSKAMIKEMRQLRKQMANLEELEGVALAFKELTEKLEQSK